MNKKNISIIIPAYQPDEKMISIIKELMENGFDDILVIDDGSNEACKEVFEEVEQIKECTLLHHHVNRGKGAALKTAITYFQENRPNREVIVTVDADGQHLVKDIEVVSMTALKSKKAVLGVRNFSDLNIPARSLIGNKMTSAVFRLFFGMKIKDTQTGLRAFPKEYLSDMLEVEGERYEYETNVLIWINRLGIPYEQVDITTVYIEENKTSHFRIVYDSLRIYALILKYLFSSLFAAVIDELLFYIFKKWMILDFLPIPLTFSATICARIISSLVNFKINAKQVFKEEVSVTALIRYYILSVVQLLVSAMLVYIVEYICHISAPLVSTIIKAFIDTMLFFVSFRIQHRWVFNNKSKKKGKC